MNKQLKLKFYYDHVLSSVYSEGESPFHQQITKDVLTRFIDPENVPKDARIIDLGCGPGYFLNEMRDRGYTNTLGISLSREDIEMCQRNGHATRLSDMNFLEERDESVDFLFCRHSIEHSPFPYITLLEYNRALKPNGLLYLKSRSQIVRSITKATVITTVCWTRRCGLTCCREQGLKPHGMNMSSLLSSQMIGCPTLPLRSITFSCVVVKWQLISNE